MTDATVVVCVATYRRPLELRRLLDSLTTVARRTSVRIILVDNDPAGSGRAALEDSPLDIDYVIERRPGIAAARNAALDRVRNDEWLAFVDDDERVGADWLERLLGTAALTDADVVSGPVISVFAPHAPRWIERGGFIQRARTATGDPLESPATNNTIVRASLWRRAGSPRFGRSIGAGCSAAASRARRTGSCE